MNYSANGVLPYSIEQRLGRETDRAIADSLGVSKSVVGQWRRRSNKPAFRIGSTDRLVERIMLGAPWSDYGECAVVLKRSYGHIKTIARKNELGDMFVSVLKRRLK